MAPPAQFVGDDWEAYQRYLAQGGFDNPGQAPGVAQPEQGALPWDVAKRGFSGDYTPEQYAQMVVDPHSSPLGGITESVLDPGAPQRRAAVDTAGMAVDIAQGPIDAYQAALSGVGSYTDMQRLGPNELVRYGAGPDLEMGDALAMGDELSLSGVDPRDVAASQWEDFEVDPTGRNAQVDTLGYFQNLAEGGPDAVAEADFERRRGQAEQARRAQDEATMAALEARGMGGSGQELLGSLVSNQAAASDLTQAGLDAAAMAQQRRDAAAGNVGQVGQALSAQDYRQAADQANALDQRALDQWRTWYDQATYNAGVGNTQNQANWGRQQDVNQANWQQQQALNQTNWGRGNTVRDANVDQTNAATMYNKGLYGDEWDRRMQALGGLTGAVGQKVGAQENAAGLQLDAGKNEKNELEQVGGFIMGLLG